jgi:hypothetical protein
MKTQPELIHYVRDDKTNNPIGVVIASLDSSDQISIGWSRRHTHYDAYDKSKGLMIARNRIETATRAELPRDMKQIYIDMSDRAIRYFNGYNLCPSVIVGLTAIAKTK